jgi:hypothetical protein
MAEQTAQDTVVRWQLSAALVRTMHVAIGMELSDRPAHVPATHDEQVVQALSAHGSDAALGVGLRRRSLDRRVLMMRRPLEVNTASKAVVNFASRSRIKNLKCPGSGRCAQSEGLTVALRSRGPSSCLPPVPVSGVAGASSLRLLPDLDRRVVLLLARMLGRLPGGARFKTGLAELAGRGRCVELAGVDDVECQVA